MTCFDERELHDVHPDLGVDHRSQGVQDGQLAGPRQGMGRRGLVGGRDRRADGVAGDGLVGHGTGSVHPLWRRPLVVGQQGVDWTMSQLPMRGSVGSARKRWFAGLP
jgi:hypothetical protein